MRKKKKMLIGNKQSINIPNTFIGGVGATSVTSIADLVAKTTGLLAGNISLFAIDGSNNVECHINTNYEIFNGAFTNDTAITYYLDNAGLVTVIGNGANPATFLNCTNLTIINFPSATFIGSQSFQNTRIVEAVLNSATDGGNFIFNSNPALKIAYLNSFNGNSSSMFMNCTSLLIAELASLTDLADNAFNNCEALRYFENTSVVSGNGQLTFRNIASILDIYLPNITFTDTLFYLSSTGIRRVYMKSATTIGDSTFSSCTGMLRINIASATLIGANNTVNNNVFLNLKTNCKIYVNPAMLTINAGGLEADLAYAQTTRSATIVSVTNTTAPSAVSDLSTSGITTTTVTLNFTTPSSANAIDFYEVLLMNNDATYPRWILWSEITASGQNVTGLTSGVNYSIRIRTADIYWNISDRSNEVTFTTL